MRRLALLLLLAAAPGFAAEAGREGFLFSRLGGEAAAAALGPGGCALAPGEAGLFANPAAALLRPDLSFQATHLEWFEAFRGETLAALAPVGDETAIGASLFLFTHRAVETTTDEVPDGTGEPLRFLGLEGTVLGAQWYGEHAGFGISARVLHEEVGRTARDAMLLDVGGVFLPAADLTVGAAIRGVGQQVQAKAVRDPVPLSVLGGVRWDLEDAPVRVFAGGCVAPYGPSTAGGSLEVGEILGASFRGGAGWREGDLLEAGLGAGWRWDMWNLDYAWSTAGAAGYAHRLTLAVRFPRGRLS